MFCSLKTRYIPCILLMRKNSFPMFTEDNARQTEAIFKQRKDPNLFLWMNIFCCCTHCANLLANISLANYCTVHLKKKIRILSIDNFNVNCRSKQRPSHLQRKQQRPKSQQSQQRNRQSKNTWQQGLLS